MTDRWSPTPIALQGAATPVQVAGGLASTCAITSGSEVQCWGANDHGNLGDGTTTSRAVPAKVTGVSGATVVATGWFHTCAIAGGALSCWGDNFYGQLGIGSTTDQHTATTVTLPATPIEVGAGEHHTCALLSDESVWCWGANDVGQLGITGIDYALTPSHVPGVTASSLAVGADHTCVVTTAGDTKCWGNNTVGQLGDGAAIVDTSARPAMFGCP